MLPSKIYNIGIILLVLVYLIVNFIHKKPTNIIIFLISYVILYSLTRNHYNSLIVSYIVSIIIGICKNFHLLENFEIEYNIENDKNTIKTYKKPKIKNNKNTIKTYKKPKIKNNEINNIVSEEESKTINKPKLIVANIKSLISDELLDAFIDHVKNKNIKVYNKKISIFNLQPTIKKIDRNKVNNIQKLYKEKIKTKQIVVSKDLFIIDGHHRWYAKKIIINETIDYDIDPNSDILVIDMSIKNLIKEIKKFKINHNQNELDNLHFDKKKLLKAKEFIQTIKINIHNLENYYAELNKLKLY